MITRLYVTAHPATPTYGIYIYKRVSHIKCIINHDLSYRMSTTLALYYISQKQIIGMERATFVTSWYYSLVQLIDS